MSSRIFYTDVGFATRSPRFKTRGDVIGMKCAGRMKCDSNHICASGGGLGAPRRLESLNAT
jgi:hypothetical protein